MSWIHYLCEIKGRNASVLVDKRFVGHFPLKEVSRLLWVGIYCKLPAEGAFWNPDETNTLQEIENDLIKLGQQFGNGWLVYVLLIATPGMREYYFYYGEHAEVDKIITSLKALHPSYRIESDAIDDPQWVEYRNYALFEPEPIVE